jgi:valyl-tRNA synthetase
VGTEAPSDKENWVQDSDVMDTWFSSWLWPFATMDEATRDKFYPTTDLVTGPDIIFFWVARMIMAGYRFQKEKPFSNVFFTSIIRDKIGRKMSKSLGNSPDPLDLIADYGADGLRFGLMRIAPTGTDVRFDENQISEGRNFANKLYNAVRFRLMQGTVEPGATPRFSAVHIAIIAKLKQLHADVDKALADYEFNSLIQSLYQFFWSEYCDRFLEAVKGDLREGADSSDRAAALTVMDTVLRHYLALLHPVMPHITEELWSSLGFAEAHNGLPLMQTPLPSPDALLAGLDEKRIAEACLQASALYETANKARNLKAEYDLAQNKNVSFILKPSVPLPSDFLSRLTVLANAKSVTAEADYVPAKGTPASLTALGELLMPLDGLIDVEAERKRLNKELEKIASEITKCSAKLQNPGFVERAPANVVDQERQRLTEWENKQAQLRTMLDSLS